MDELPIVTVVLLAFNRREELRTTLAATRDLEYPPARLETIVVDNASTDGTAAMVAEEFPCVSVVKRSTNVGIAGWNDGLERARGDFVLLLDDDCYLTGDSLRRAVAAAQTHAADLVSFRIRSALDHDHVFQREYEAGLLSFWGCAVLLSRRAAVALGGFDPEIFVWAHEPEFTIRLLDSGLRHLHAPEIDAYHQVAPLRPRGAVFYRLNARNLAPRETIRQLEKDKDTLKGMAR